MLAGRINTNGLIMDGGGGAVWNNSESGANRHLYIGTKTVGMNTGEGVTTAEV